ncbi:MAG: DUF2325 domain-containing protein [Pseudomonadota bacterium]
MARKLNLSFSCESPSDYSLHSFFVGEAGKSGLAAKAINKLLDRKHAGSIRRAAKIKTTSELTRFWEQSFEQGDIPGPLWACVTHTELEIDLGTKIYGEIHMLSHMVGAANRADISALKRLQSEVTSLEQKLEGERRRSQSHAEKNLDLTAKLAEQSQQQKQAESSIAHLNSKLLAAGTGKDGVSSLKPQLTTADREELRQLRNTFEEQNLYLEKLRQDLIDTRAREEALVRECRALESLLGNLSDGEEPGPSFEPTCPFDFNGQCILYVGGRSKVVCRLRELVQQGNGSLLHHDGGMEKSIDELASAVARADQVVFPIDCVSHSAVKKLKTLCRRSMKPYVPLRSAGLSSFVAGLQSVSNGQLADL